MWFIQLMIFFFFRPDGCNVSIRIGETDFDSVRSMWEVGHPLLDIPRSGRDMPTYISSGLFSHFRCGLFMSPFECFSRLNSLFVTLFLFHITSVSLTTYIKMTSNGSDTFRQLQRHRALPSNMGSFSLTYPRREQCHPH